MRNGGKAVMPLVLLIALGFQLLAFSFHKKGKF